MVNLILAAINNSFIEFNRKENLALFSIRKKERTLSSPSSPEATTAKFRKKIHSYMPLHAKTHILNRICYQIAYNPFFVLFSLGIILANSILLGFYRYPMKADLMQKIEVGLTVFVFYFVFELIIRISAMGIKHFVRDFENIIETLTVILGLINFIYEETQGFSGQESNILRATRSFMLLRIVKVMNFFKSIKLIIKTIKQTIWKMVDFVIVLLIFMCVAALIGMQLFAYRVRFDAEDNPILNAASK